ncbi:MAG TPA: helix-turn-helix domain-containing protein [Steroidobacteraceae bacterium]|nr:helix-turn-helix domain-containing protein [Steroidobacteraceae bacterium]
MAPVLSPPMPTMSQEEKQFFVELGARMAELRKDLGMTQQQLAAALETTQQQVASYESARLRVPASMLPRLARVLGVTLERLIGDEQRSAGKRGPTPKLQQQLERLSALPKPKQRAVMEVLEAMLAQANR